MDERVVMYDIGLCPCGAKIMASLEPPCVAHESPVCQKFSELTPDEFVTYVRKHRESSQ